MSRPLLSVKDLFVEFQAGGERVVAVDAISYDLKPGEVLAVVGESGCGKTTHVLAALRLLPIESAHSVTGSVRYSGEDLLQASGKRLRALRGSEIASISQDPYATLDPMFSIGAHFKEMETRSKDASGYEARLLDLLAHVGLENPRGLLRARPHELSGGTAQRISLALALWPGPRLLFADEPTSALDPIIQAQMLRAIDDYVRYANGSVVFITHNIGLAATLADRVAVMYAGQIVEIGTRVDVLDNPLHPYSAGLLKSRPSIRLRPHRLPVLVGDPPNPGALPAGCSFHPRCPLAQDRCSEEAPPPTLEAPGRWVRCWMAARTS